MYTISHNAIYHRHKKHSTIYLIIALTPLFLSTTMHAAAPDPDYVFSVDSNTPLQRTRSSQSCPEMPSPERPRAEKFAASSESPGHTRCHQCEKHWRETSCRKTPQHASPRPFREPYDQPSSRKRPTRLNTGRGDHSRHRPTGVFHEELSPPRPRQRYSESDEEELHEQRERDRDRAHWENMLPYRNYPILGLILLCYDNYPKLTLAAIAATAGVSVRNYDKIIELYQDAKERLKKEFLRLKFRYIKKNGKKTTHKLMHRIHT